MDKPEYSIFSNSKDCLVYPLTKWCGQRSLLLEIKKNQKGGVVKTGATEKSVSYSGAKGNIAYVGAYTFRFLTPDGKAWVKLSGKGTSLQEAKRTIRLKK